MSEVTKLSSTRRQVGPTLYWTAQKPKVGDVFECHSGRCRVVDVTPDLDVSGGYLFTTEDANG